MSVIVMGILLVVSGIYFFFKQQSYITNLTALQYKQIKLTNDLRQVQKQYEDLKGQNQYQINQQLQQNIKNIQTTYNQSVTLYQQLVDLKAQTNNTQNLDTLFAQALQDLSVQNYTSSSAVLQQLSDGIQKQESAIASAVVNSSSNAPSHNSLPSIGFSQQSVTADIGTFLVSIIAADLNTTRVIVDTASDVDCSNNCPTMSLADYVSRNGAFAGINGTFFCPTEYPSCAGKTNSFDTLLMNKNKHYFNSANNVYSTVPLVYFTGNAMGVRSQTLNWGRDTSVDSVIAMQPLLISTGNIVYGGSNDGKYTNKGTRDFIANKGNMVYIGVIYNADMNDAAHVLKTLAVDNALNLDEGGSTALWDGGYKAGPGRNIPNAVLFVRK